MVCRGGAYKWRKHHVETGQVVRETQDEANSGFYILAKEGRQFAGKLHFNSEEDFVRTRLKAGRAFQTASAAPVCV
jgi:hypothetical protein